MYSSFTSASADAISPSEVRVNGINLLKASNSALRAFVSFLGIEKDSNSKHDGDFHFLSALSNYSAMKFPRNDINIKNIRFYNCPRSIEESANISPEPFLENSINTTSSTFHSYVLSEFPKFVASSIYASWLEEELDMKDTGRGRDERLDALFEATQAEFDAAQSVIDRAFASMDPVDTSKLQSTGRWIEGLIAACEDLPVGVTLASAFQEHYQTFPLMYGNKAAEEIWGCSRRELIGRNLKSLICQPLESHERERTDRISWALASALAVKATLSTCRRDGTRFEAVHACKPIFDTEGNCRYILGLHLDVKAATLSPLLDLRLVVDDLLSILPNVVFIEEAATK